MTVSALRLFREISVLSTLVLGAVVGLAACGSITAIDADGGSGGSVGTGGSATGTGGSATGSGGATGGGGGGGGIDARSDGRVDAADVRSDADASDVQPVACQGLNETMCRARTDCAVKTCTACSGAAAFAGCYRPGVDMPPACVGVPCPPTCAGLSEAACKTRMDCRTDYCPDCVDKTFMRCSAPTDPQTGCLPIACPPPLPCAQNTTLAQCEARTDCHSVFVDRGNCACSALGCCATFTRCADGDRAACKGMPACDALAPYCEGPYVVSYTNSCYEGCVHMKDCAP